VEEVVALATAVAVLQPRADSEVSGMVAFVETSDGVKVVADIARVAPGMHGLHLHELGDCSSDDFKSTGGHFNPTDAPHGAPTDEMRHAGDFGNIEIGEDGAGHLELATTMLSVGDGPYSVVGRAVILHDGEDDLVSQPTGAAGGRIGCGVVMLEGSEVDG
jgi:Cu-Zn family superoxide dismutase